MKVCKSLDQVKLLNAYDVLAVCKLFQMLNTEKGFHQIFELPLEDIK